MVTLRSRTRASDGPPEGSGDVHAAPSKQGAASAERIRGIGMGTAQVSPTPDPTPESLCPRILRPEQTAGAAPAQSMHRSPILPGCEGSRVLPFNRGWV